MNFARYQEYCLVTESNPHDAIHHLVFGPTADKGKNKIDYICESFEEEVAAKQTTTDNVRLIHSCLGLITEMEELGAAAKAADTKNIIEELGDICWFSAVGLKALRISELDFRKHGEFLVANPVEFEQVSVDFADNIKKYMFYGKPFKNGNDYLASIFHFHLDYVSKVANALGLDIREIWSMNIRKLQARYGDKFSKAKALDRDKIAEYEAIDYGTTVDENQEDLSDLEIIEEPS